MSEFIFTQKKKGECVIVVDSPLEADFSSGEWLAKKVREISGAEISMLRRKEEISQRKVVIGTLPQSLGAQKALERGNIILGSDSPEVRKLTFDRKSCSLSENQIAVAKSSMLRRNFLYPEDLGEQGFIVYKADEDTLILCGNTPQGTFYAVQTLINHLYLHDGNLRVEDLHTERFPIFNRPAIPYRGVCTNIGGPDHIARDQWVKEWEKEGEYDYKGFIDWLAEFKVTHLNIWLFGLGFGIAYPSKKFPECVNKYHPNVKKEFIGEMIEYAHQKFIDVSTLIDFPDMFSGILRHHPELGAKQFNSSKLPPEEDWEAYQKTGENKNGYDFRGEFGTVCASKPEAMSFWEEYLEEVFSRYPGLDGIMGQFAEGITEICTCNNCQNSFLQLQWQYFKRMAEIVQKDRPERKIYNCASPGDVEILRHREEIKNFIHLDWGNPFPPYGYGRACPRGEWYLFHHSGAKWTEFDWKHNSRLLTRFHFEGTMKRTVSYKPCENDHFAFGEFAWDPELKIEDYAELYIKKVLHKKDKETSVLYSHWIKLRGYKEILECLHEWGENKIPFSAKRIDEDYAYLIKEELTVVSSLLKEIKSKNQIVEEIENALLSPYNIIL